MGFVLMIPFLLVRFGLLSILGRGAVLRAAYFAPLQKREKAAYWVYQLSTAAIFLSLFFLRIRTAPSGLYAAGIAVYAAGILLLAVTVCHFAVLSENGFNQSGIYRLSRNPMYISLKQNRFSGRSTGAGRVEAAPAVLTNQAAAPAKTAGCATPTRAQTGPQTFGAAIFCAKGSLGR